MRPDSSPLVIKVGSAVLTGADGLPDRQVIARLAGEVADLARGGRRVCLVTSGAVSTGLGILGRKTRPRRMSQKQAMAALGQPALMGLYAQAFGRHGLFPAQVLLTHQDLAHREGFVNIRQTMNELLDSGIVPVVNENDTVSTREIRFGDNDILAVLVANVVEASQVVILTTAPGLMDLAAGRLLTRVERIDGKVLSLASGGNRLGSGGMGSKLLAIDRLMRAGRDAYLADGRRPHVIRDLLAGLPCGTHFPARGRQRDSKRQWMLDHLRPSGRLHLDDGAFKAVGLGKASLLLPGVSAVEGVFRAGQLVSLCHGGKEFARGVARLSSADIDKVRRVPREEAERILGADAPRFAVHRNDIAAFDEDPGG